MQVSTVCANVYTIFGNTDTQTPNTANSSTLGIVLKSIPTTTGNDTDEQNFTHINEWKRFCCKQIEANNIDFIA